MSKLYYAPASSGWNQHKALHLADQLEASPHVLTTVRRSAASELRRLHALNAEMQQCLQRIAAIARHKGLA